MDKGMQLYYDYTISPLGKLFYQTVQKQLSNVCNKKVLDFGSGFGFTANFLAHNNEVTAIEQNKDMIANSLNTNNYQLINGDLNTLKNYQDEYFDFICCHLVLEFVDDPSIILNELLRVLKKGGQLSIIRHHKNGRIIQAIVSDYDLKEVNTLLNNGYSYSSAFGDIKYYNNDDLINWCNNITINNIYGIRALASLHNSDIQNQDNWVNEMLDIEFKLLAKEEFINIAYFNHLIICKN